MTLSIEVPDEVAEAVQSVFRQAQSDAMIAAQNLIAQAVAEGKVARRDGGGKPCFGCGN